MGSEASIGWPSFCLLTRVASRRVSKTSLKSFAAECETEMLEHPICVELSPLATSIKRVVWARKNI